MRFMDIKTQDARLDGMRTGLQLVKRPMREELGVALSDFLPNEGGHLMRLSTGTVVISTRLRNALRDYGAHRAMSIVQALERLRDEVQ